MAPAPSTAQTPAYAGVSVVPWDDVVTAMDWRPGEHVTLIGPTGVGKTELAAKLLELRTWWIFLSTKRIDSTQDDLRPMGPRRIADDVVDPQIASRYIVAPKWDRKLNPADQDKAHAAIFSRVLARAFYQTGWTVCIDELEYINRDLNIVAPVNRLFRQGRSQKNSMLTATQRPRHVTLHAYEQATHLFIWRQHDLSNVARAAELAGVNRASVMEVVPHLPKHDVLYVNIATGAMFVTNTRS